MQRLLGWMQAIGADDATCWKVLTRIAVDCPLDRRRHGPAVGPDHCGAVAAACSADLAKYTGASSANDVWTR